jgi:hypothetical protein
MHAGETFGDYRVKGSYNGQFAPIVLGKITKRENFCFHYQPPWGICELSGPSVSRTLLSGAFGFPYPAKETG